MQSSDVELRRPKSDGACERKHQEYLWRTPLLLWGLTKTWIVEGFRPAETEAESEAAASCCKITLVEGFRPEETETTASRCEAAMPQRQV